MSCKDSKCIYYDECPVNFCYDDEYCLAIREEIQVTESDE